MARINGYGAKEILRLEKIRVHEAPLDENNSSYTHKTEYVVTDNGRVLVKKHWKDNSVGEWHHGTWHVHKDLKTNKPVSLTTKNSRLEFLNCLLAVGYEIKFEDKNYE